MLEKMLPVLAQYIHQGDRLIVGVSGGPDSTALLDVLVHALENSHDLVVVAHVNHGIRGRQSDADEKFVQSLAKKYDLPYEVKRINLAGKSHQEERGRTTRREFFEKLRQQYTARWILTAHTADDQVESIVFNFLRGSGPAGLAGMKMAQGPYLKPFLETPKREILVYLKRKRLKFCQDRTNHDTRYSRNLIRKKILPLMEKINPSLRKTLRANAEIFRTLTREFEEKADQFLGSKETAPMFLRKEFLSLSEPLQTVVIQHMFQRGSRQHYRLPLAKVAQVRQLIQRNIGKKTIQTGKHGDFFLEKGVMRFKRFEF